MVEEKSKRKICVLIFHRSTFGQFHLAHEGVVNLDLMPPQLPTPGAAAPLQGISGVVGPKRVERVQCSYPGARRDMNAPGAFTLEESELQSAILIFKGAFCAFDPTRSERKNFVLFCSTIFASVRNLSVYM